MVPLVLVLFLLERVWPAPRPLPSCPLHNPGRKPPPRQTRESMELLLPSPCGAACHSETSVESSSSEGALLPLSVETGVELVPPARAGVVVLSIAIEAPFEALRVAPKLFSAGVGSLFRNFFALIVAG